MHEKNWQEIIPRRKRRRAFDIPEKIKSKRLQEIVDLQLKLSAENNKKDLEDIPEHIVADLKFHTVKHMDQVLEIALIRSPFPKAKKILHTPPTAFA